MVWSVGLIMAAPDDDEARQLGPQNHGQYCWCSDLQPEDWGSQGLVG